MSIGDGVIISNSLHLPEGIPAATIIGNRTVVGAGSLLTSNIVDENCVIGENCVLREGARMERGSSLGCNSVLAAAVCIPAGQHWAGSPATFQGPFVPDTTNSLRYPPLTQRPTDGRSPQRHLS